MSAIYRVYVAQEVHYQTDIEANSEEEAEQIAFEGNYLDEFKFITRT